MGLPATAVWPLLFLVAVSPETIPATTETALKASSVATGTPSTPALVQAGSSVPDKSTLSKATETPLANWNTSIAPAVSILTENPTTEAVSRTPWSTTPGPENSTAPEGSDEPPTSLGKEPAGHSTVTAQPSSGGDDNDESSVSQKPGLIAVICIFVSILLVGTGVVLVKCCRAREPSFKKLDEVPMGNVTEGSPFARYPPK